MEGIDPTLIEAHLREVENKVERGLGRQISDEAGDLIEAIRADLGGNVPEPSREARLRQ